MSVLDEVKAFTKSRLRTVETTVTTVDGRRYVESSSSDDTNTIVASNDVSQAWLVPGFVVDLSPDLQVGQVRPYLSFGSQDVADDVVLMKSHGVTHVLNVATGIVPSICSSGDYAFVYKSVGLLDTPDFNVRDAFEECFEYVDGVRDDGGHVFVHCNAGVSRSSTVVIAYLMSRCGMRFDAAYDYVRTKRSVARPNDGFVHQLRTYDAELYGSPLTVHRYTSSPSS